MPTDVEQQPQTNQQQQQQNGKITVFPAVREKMGAYIESHTNTGPEHFRQYEADARHRAQEESPRESFAEKTVDAMETLKNNIVGEAPKQSDAEVSEIVPKMNEEEGADSSLLDRFGSLGERVAGVKDALVDSVVGVKEKIASAAGFGDERGEEENAQEKMKEELLETANQKEAEQRKDEIEEQITLTAI